MNLGAEIERIRFSEGKPRANRLLLTRRSFLPPGQTRIKQGKGYINRAVETGVQRVKGSFDISGQSPEGFAIASTFSSHGSFPDVALAVPGRAWGNRTRRSEPSSAGDGQRYTSSYASRYASPVGNVPERCMLSPAKGVPLVQVLVLYPVLSALFTYSTVGPGTRIPVESG